MKTAHRLILSLLLAAITLTLPGTARAEGGVPEQFNLAPGGTYYFDLSGVNIPGTLNPNLPDTSLHWVPFTYVGTINAYSLDAGSIGDPSAPDRAEVNDRSLFVSACDVSSEVTYRDGQCSIPSARRQRFRRNGSPHTGAPDTDNPVDRASAMPSW